MAVIMNGAHGINNEMETNPRLNENVENCSMWNKHQQSQICRPFYAHLKKGSSNNNFKIRSILSGIMFISISMNAVFP